MQAFIQALFSTALFPQRFSFFTVCLVQWHHGPWGGPMVDTKENVLKFRSADRCKMHFSWIFFFNFRVSWGSFEENLAGNIYATFLYACL